MLAVCILGAAWAPLIGLFGNLWIYLQTVQAYLMMPFAGIFFAGVLWRRTTARAVLACLATACVVCPIFMADGQWHFLPFMDHPVLRPWLHAAFVAFLVCMAVLVAVSLASPRPEPERLETTTVRSWSRLVRANPGPLAGNYLLWLGLLLATCTGLWVLMR